MSESNFSHNLEAEIAELNQEIERKREELEKLHGVVEEREVVSHVLAQHVFDDSQQPVVQPTQNQTVSPKPAPASYLDSLDTDTINTVNELISSIPQMGIKKTIARAKLEHPLVLDAFHDALVSKLYPELKARGLVK